jgi:predicted membrane protein
VVYLNENLFIRPNRLLFTFYHEHYHVISHHKRNILLHRILFSCVPLLLYFHWIAALVVYVSAAYLMEIVRRRYENKANAYAKKMYLSGEIKPQ